MGNRTATKCHSCRRSYSPTKAGQLYCSHKCRQAAYRAKHSKKKRAQRRATPAALPAVCHHCRGSYWAKNSRSQFCSTSCRTLHHKSRRNSIPVALAAIYGIPREAAEDLLDTQPIAKLKQLLNQAGFLYVHEAKSWLSAGDFGGNRQTDL